MIKRVVIARVWWLCTCTHWQTGQLELILHGGAVSLFPHEPAQSTNGEKICCAEPTLPATVQGTQGSPTSSRIQTD